MKKKLSLIFIIVLMLIPSLSFADTMDITDIDTIDLIEPKSIAACPVNGYHEATLSYFQAYLYADNNYHCDVFVCDHCDAGLYISVSDFSTYHIGVTLNGSPYDHIVSESSMRFDGSINMYNYLGWHGIYW